METLPDGTYPPVTFTDLAGDPVGVCGEILSFPSAAGIGDKALAEKGLAFAGNQWFGLRSKVMVPSPSGEQEDPFRVTYLFPDPNGAGDFSDDGDERYGCQVTDAHLIFGGPFPWWKSPGCRHGSALISGPELRPSGRSSLFLPVRPC